MMIEKSAMRLKKPAPTSKYPLLYVQVLMNSTILMFKLLCKCRSSIMITIFFWGFFGVKIFFLLATYCFSTTCLSRSNEIWPLIGIMIESNYSDCLWINVFKMTVLLVPCGPRTLKFLFSSPSCFM